MEDDLEFEVDDKDKSPADLEFERLRNEIVEICKKHVPCDRPPLMYGCERCECICAEIACEVAGMIAYPYEKQGDGMSGGLDFAEVAQAIAGPRATRCAVICLK